MTPRVDAWMRQANSDWAVADRFDEQDSEEARSAAEHVLAFAKASLQA